MTNDPLSRAMSAQPRPRLGVFFGELDFDIWDCVLQKGAGKVPFDPAAHKEDDLRTAIQMSLIPLSGSPIRNNVDREMIAESDEWAKVVLPSLKAIGADLRGLKNKFVQVKLVPTGRSYTNSAGETKDATTFEFVAVYPSEAECRAAADTMFGSARPAPAANPTMAPGAAPINSNARRTLALKFVPKLWTQAGYDVEKLEQLLKANPLTAQLNIADDDVIALLSVDAEKIAAAT